MEFRFLEIRNFREQINDHTPALSDQSNDPLLLCFVVDGEKREEEVGESK